MKDVIRYLGSCLVLALFCLAGCSSAEVDPAPQPSATMIPPTLTLAPSAIPITQTDAAAALPAGWVREQFGLAWNIAYPADWQVDAAGVHEGALVMEGAYQDHTYLVRFAVPILGVPLDSASLESWVEQESAALVGDVQTTDMQLAGLAAVRLSYTPLDPAQQVEQRLYIWRSAIVNPRLIVLQQIDAAPSDVAQMQELLHLLAAGVQ